MRIRRNRDSIRDAAGAQPFGEPRAVDAVAGAEDVAAGDALVRLHEIGTVASECVAHRPRKSRVAPDAADEIRVADDGLDLPRPFRRP